MSDVELMPIEEALIDEIDDFWEKEGPNNAYDCAVASTLRKSGWSDEDIVTSLGYLPDLTDASPDTGLEVFEKDLEKTLADLGLSEVCGPRLREIAWSDSEADSVPLPRIAAE